MRTHTYGLCSCCSLLWTRWPVRVVLPRVGIVLGSIPSPLPKSNIICNGECLLLQVRILNNQLQALTHMDGRIDALASRLDAVSGILFSIQRKI